MKSVLNKLSKEPEISYPCLVRYKQTANVTAAAKEIVFLQRTAAGPEPLIVLYTPKATNVGIGANWGHSAELYEAYEGSVTLSNE